MFDIIAPSEPSEPAPPHRLPNVLPEPLPLPLPIAPVPHVHHGRASPSDCVVPNVVSPRSALSTPANGDVVLLKGCGSTVRAKPGH